MPGVGMTKTKPRQWLGFRCTEEEARIAKHLGKGNVSEGVRRALRYAYGKATPVPLSVMLRAASEIARDLEGSR